MKRQELEVKKMADFSFDACYKAVVFEVETALFDGYLKGGGVDETG